MPRHVSRWRSGYLNQQANLGEGAPKLPEGRALKILRAADASDAGLGSPAIAAAPIEPRDSSACANAFVRPVCHSAPIDLVPFGVSALACSGLRMSMLSQTAVNELTGSEEAPQAASLEDKWERIEARSRHLDAMTDAERDVLFADVAALVEAEGGHSSDALNSMADCEMLEWGMPCGSTPAPSVARPVGVAPARPLTGGRASSASWRVQPICC